jgi:hypothetical protein
MRSLSRSVGAVVAGFVLLVALSVGTDAALRAAGVFPPAEERMSDGLFVLATAYRFVYGIAGCFLAARLAPSRPMRHAWVLGWVGAAAGLAGLIATWNQIPELGPRWYSIAVFAMPLPCAWIGGKMHRPKIEGQAA